MITLRCLLSLVLMIALPCAAASPEAVAKAALARVGAGESIGAVRAAPVAGWLEVEVGSEVVYVSADGRHVLSGRLLDTVAGTDLIEDNDYDDDPADFFKTGPQQKFRRRGLTTVIDLRNL